MFDNKLEPDWTDGNMSSGSDKFNAYIEFDHDTNMWFIYQLDSSGSLKECFPKMTSQGFKTRGRAKAWIKSNRKRYES